MAEAVISEQELESLARTQQRFLYTETDVGEEPTGAMQGFETQMDELLEQGEPPSRQQELQAFEEELFSYLSEVPDPLARQCSVQWEDEMPSLEAIYGEDIEYFNESKTIFRIQICQDVPPPEKLWLHFVIFPMYPTVPPEVSLERASGQKISAHLVPILYSLLRHESLKMRCSPMIYALCAAATSLLERMWNAEELQAFLIERGIETDVAVDAPVATPDMKMSLDELERIARKNKVTFNPAEYLGPLAKIVKMVTAAGVDVVHVENVVRSDLALRFELQRRYYWRKYVGHRAEQTKGVRNILGRLAAPVLAFHGTRTSSVGSIVHNGLMVPGQDSGITVRVGSLYGVGIYLSPEPATSLSFSSGGKLLVCAALLGKPYVVPERLNLIGQSHCEPGFDSHYAPDYPCYVLFKESQVLPCYVIHFTRQEVLGREMHNSQHVSSTLAGLPIKEKRKILTARARKHFPFGFGPAGSRFEVEEIADCSDDEYEGDDMFEGKSYENEYAAAKGLDRDNWIPGYQTWQNYQS